MGGIHILPKAGAAKQLMLAGQQAWHGAAANLGQAVTQAPGGNLDFLTGDEQQLRAGSHVGFGQRKQQH